ncbi:DEAD/DEAH box helicase family protein [uncultured Ruminobacter sp.]|uniref:DEAD/DEAH box helicase family protein n=1 Tax=uncultured Ruminobacter sp. TaxID=538947 RepID=UPI0025EEDE3E|nr:DEAD/DEAH box helicase family protein [uncultured Ruminobacter sp.]
MQSFNSKKLTDVVKPDFYDDIVVDECHNVAAPSYQELLDYFRPKTLLGLTADSSKKWNDRYFFRSFRHYERSVS